MGSHCSLQKQGGDGDGQGKGTEMGMSWAVQTEARAPHRAGRREAGCGRLWCGCSGHPGGLRAPEGQECGRAGVAGGGSQVWVFLGPPRAAPIHWAFQQRQADATEPGVGFSPVAKAALLGVCNVCVHLCVHVCPMCACVCPCLYMDRTAVLSSFRIKVRLCPSEGDQSTRSSP